jgi:ribosomal protein S18 acetylase RimI-like enzyme
MRVTLVPFVTDHLEPAAALLAARHRRDRVEVPDLPPRYEDEDATVPILRDLTASDGMRGVVALREGRVVGYLLGAPLLRPPSHMGAGFRHPRSAQMPYAAHAVDPEGSHLYPLLYAALAEEWVTSGLLGHYVYVPAILQATEVWTDLSFGRFIALAVRGTGLPSGNRAGEVPGIVIRRATIDDADVVQSQMTELFHSFAEPPLFVPCLPETDAARHHDVADYLADPMCPHWLAVANDRVVGLLILETPTSSQWHQPPLQSPPGAVYIDWAWTAPEMRSRGVGGALFVHAMTWAQEAGYASCMVDYMTASRAAAFWRNLGFRPVSYLLRRVVDDRVAWVRH